MSSNLKMFGLNKITKRIIIRPAGKIEFETY